MIMKLLPAAVAIAGILTMGGCQLDQAKTVAPAPKVAADYQAPVPPNPSAGLIRANCYNDADLAAVRARMLQQELVVTTLQCQNPNGSRAFEGQYASFINKFNGELATNSRALSQIAGRKRLNVDVLVTEIANRTAQRAPIDKEFCSRGKRALNWALDPKVTSLAQVPPPFDLGPEMDIYACPAR